MTGTFTEFKFAIKNYLSSLDIGSLRSYGRNVGVFNPTTKKKGELIDDIVGILSGELQPTPRSNLGAPVKSAYVSPEIEEAISKIQMTYLNELPLDPTPPTQYDLVPDVDMTEAMRNFKKEHRNVLSLADPEAEEMKAYQKNRELRRGQLETLNGVSLLLPLNCRDEEEKVIMPVALIKKHNLREGDIISCYAIKHNASWIATELLAINNLLYETVQRFQFDAGEACYASKRLRTYDKKYCPGVTAKYLDWIIPLGFGQRGCVFGAPKTGKTSVLLSIAEASKFINSGWVTLVLLIDQPPETVSLFRNITQSDDLVYTTYDDDPEKQVFAADFMLRRAKSIAECGLDVLLIVDSFTALARAYNDTKASMGGKVLAGGLESKTLQYLKKYFGTARCFKKSGSLTMIGGVSVDTGNPMDDIIAAELANLSNVDLRLNEKAAAKHIYPSIDVAESTVKQNTLLQSQEEIDLDFILRNEFMPRFGIQELNNVVAKASDYLEFKKLILTALK